MSRYSRVKLTCPICGESRMIKRSWITRVFTCGKKECTKVYKFQQFIDRIQQEQDEPIETLVKRLYILEQRPYRYIYKKLGISNHTFAKLLHYYGIQPRQGGDAIRTQWIGNKRRRKKASENLREIAKSQAGENHPFWKGGAARKYSIVHWTKLADKIRDRDNHCCTLCSMTEEEHKRLHTIALDVHHIIPYKLSKDNSPSNLRTLCRSCHVKKELEFLWLL